jgi:Xaa-Pro aminopeptidase
VTLDLGAQLDGYCSDCTRTWATGELDGDLAAVYDLVLRAQETALGAVRPGPTGREVDAVARDLIAAEGHGEHFGHGLGHGVGLEIHEAPRLARSGTEPLAEGNVVTVEPGVYLPDRGGVRIEDLVVVTAEGCDVLSATPKALTRVD